MPVPLSQNMQSYCSCFELFMHMANTMTVCSTDRLKSFEVKSLTGFGFGVCLFVAAKYTRDFCCPKAVIFNLCAMDGPHGGKDLGRFIDLTPFPTA